MIRRTGLAPWQFEFPFPGSLTSTFLSTGQGCCRGGQGWGGKGCGGQGCGGQGSGGEAAGGERQRGHEDGQGQKVACACEKVECVLHKRLGIHGRDCVKSLGSSYAGLYPQKALRGCRWMHVRGLSSCTCGARSWLSLTEDARAFGSTCTLEKPH